MATMNNKRATIKPDTKTTLNHEGTKVHQLNALETLFSKVLGSFFGESTHYEKKTAESDYKALAQTISEVADEDIEYVLKIAQLGRAYNMISYPLNVLTACMNDERFKGESFVDEVTGRNKLQTYARYIVRRGKDILEVLSTQMNVYGFTVSTKGRGKSKKNHRQQPLPMQMRKVLKSRLESFNEYQISKALGESREVSMADAIKLLHPNPTKSRVGKNFYQKVIEGKVKMGNDVKQVQSELAKANNKNSKTTKKDVVKSIDTSTVMAIVKNLVALYNNGVLDDLNAVDSIVAKLTNKEEVRKSKLLPFRFYSAYMEVYNTFHNSIAKARILEALVDALDSSVDNLPDINGYSAILVDRSGSMRKPVSSMSTVTAEVVALILGAICFKKGIADVYVFGTSCVQVAGVTRKSTVMDIMTAMQRPYCGGGTNLDVALSVVKKSGARYDNLIILSDGDCYSVRGNSFTFTRGDYSCYNSDNNVNELIKSGVVKKVYLDNLLGNDFAIINTDDYRKNLITGFSERIVEMINTYSSIGGGASDVRVVIDSLMANITLDSLPKEQ